MNQAAIHTPHTPKSLEELQAISPRELQASVMELLNWSEEDFSEFVFETGLAYLKAYFIDDQAAVDMVSRKREFWNWFKNHWTYRDQVFFETFMLDTCDLSFRLSLYMSLHNPEVLACEIYPSRTVLGLEFPIISIQMSCI